MGAECEGTVEQINSKCMNLEKRMKQYDKIIHDMKAKADTYSQELEMSQRECRNVSAELFRIKNGFEECMNQLDEVRRENKNLADEIKDIMEQISEGGRSIHEIEKQRKKLESEKQE